MGLVSGGYRHPVSAQILPDQSLGNQATLVQPDRQIQGVLGTQIEGGAVRGSNLFHSFEQFNVGDSQRVYFSNPANIDAIFSRVTGPQASTIRGTLGVDGPADFFLVNPNGIVFGPNATLDMNGAVTITTADAIAFDDRGIFSAAQPTAPGPLLTIQPSAFLFTESVGIPGAIAFENTQIQLANQQDLLILGGDIRVDRSNIITQDGHLTLAAIGESGTVTYRPEGGIRLTQDQARGRVSLTNQSVVGTSIVGSSIVGSSIASAPEANGVRSSDVVTGGNLWVTAQRLLIDNSILRTLVSGPEQGPSFRAGDVTIEVGDRLRIENGSIASVMSAGQGRTGNVQIDAGQLTAVAGNILTGGNSGVGRAGNIIVTADQLALRGGATIISSMGQSLSQTGDITLEVSDRLRLSGQNLTTGTPSTIGLLASSSGRATLGNVSISARTVEILDGTAVVALQEGIGDGGSISIVARERITLDRRGTKLDSDSTAQNDALRGGAAILSSITRSSLTNLNQIRLQSPVLEVLNGSQILSSISEAGKGSDIVIDVAERVTLAGDTSAAETDRIVNLEELNDSKAGITTFLNSSQQQNQGIRGSRAGDISVTTPILEIFDGARILSESLLGSETGRIQIEASDRVVLDSNRTSNNARTVSGVFTFVPVLGTDDSNTIQIATNDLSIQNGAQISTVNRGSGEAGDIDIWAGDRIRIEGSSSTPAIFLNPLGGAIRGNARSSIISSALGNNNSGSIRLQSGELQVLDGGEINTSVFGQGNAGDIAIRATEGVLFQGFTADIVEGIDLNTGLASRSRLPSRAFSLVGVNATGNGGDLVIDTNRLVLRDGAQLATATFGQPRFDTPNPNNAGQIQIQARDEIIMDSDWAPEQAYGTEIFSIVGPDAQGEGGNMALTTDTLKILNGSQIRADTLGTGNGGNIVLNVEAQATIAGVGSNPVSTLTLSGEPELRAIASGITSDVFQGAIGNGGTITVNMGAGGTLRLARGAELSAVTAGRGNAGEIQVNGEGGRGNIFISGRRSDDGTPSRIANTVLASAEGNGAPIRLAGRNLTLNQGEINASSSVTIPPVSSGNARTGRSLSSSDGPIGDGPIDDRSIGDGGGDRQALDSASDPRGNAGSINLTLTNRLQATDGRITTQASAFAGGEIQINAGAIQLFGNSDIRTNVGGQRPGGDILLQGDRILVFDDSDIIAASVNGRGGNITVDTPVFVAPNFTPQSLSADPSILDRNQRPDINATGAVSGGTVTLPDVNVFQQTTTTLPATIVDPDGLISNSCVARRQPGTGQFTITGQDGLLPRPGDSAIAYYPTDDVQTVNAPREEAAGTIPPVMSSAQTTDLRTAQTTVRSPAPSSPPESQGIFETIDGRLVLSKPCQ